MNCRNTIFYALTLSTSIFVAALPSYAQTYNATIGGPGSRENNYASVRGWRVYSGSINGRFAYCVAEKSEYGFRLRLGFDNQQWQMSVPANVRPNWLGQMQIDGRTWQASGTAGGGWGTVWLSLRELDAVKNGNRLLLDIGKFSFDFSLAGTTAASLKVEECLQYRGLRQRVQPRPRPANRPKNYYAPTPRAKNPPPAVYAPRPPRRPKNYYAPTPRAKNPPPAVSAPRRPPNNYPAPQQNPPTSTPGAAPGSPPPPVNYGTRSCPNFYQYRALNSSRPARAEFISQIRPQRALQIVWIDPQGNPNNAAVFNNGRAVVNSFVGHSFVVRDYQGNCYGVYTVRSGYNQFVVR